jgi:hypothetical protein
MSDSCSEVPIGIGQTHVWFPYENLSYPASDALSFQNHTVSGQRQVDDINPQNLTSGFTPPETLNSSWTTFTSHSTSSKSNVARELPSAFRQEACHSAPGVLPLVDGEKEVANHHTSKGIVNTTIFNKRAIKGRSCDACRRRQSRCVVHEGEGTCTLCQLHKQNCTFTQLPRSREARAVGGIEKIYLVNKACTGPAASPFSKNQSLPASNTEVTFEMAAPSIHLRRRPYIMSSPNGSAASSSYISDVNQKQRSLDTLVAPQLHPSRLQNLILPFNRIKLLANQQSATIYKTTVHPENDSAQDRSTLVQARSSVSLESDHESSDREHVRASKTDSLGPYAAATQV